MADTPPPGHRLAATGVAALLALGATALLLDRGTFGPATLFHAAGVSTIAAGLLLSLLTGGGAARMRLDSVELVMLATLAWLLIALLLHPVPFLGLHQTLTWLTLPMAYVAVRRSAAGARTWYLLWCGICTTTLGLLCLSGYELLILQRVPRTLFLNPNSLAAWMTMVALVNGGLSAGLLLRGHRCAAAGVAALGLATAMVAVSIASRGALVALLVGGAILVALLARTGQQVVPRPGRLLLAALGALALAVLLGLAISPRSAIDRMVDFVGNPVAAAGSRLLIWEAGQRLAAECAPWGCGAGLFWLLFAGQKLPTDTSAGFHAHLDALEIFVELGWPGLLLLMAAIVAVMVRARQAWDTCADDPASLARLAGCGAALAAFMIQGLGTFNLYVAALVALAGVSAGGIGPAAPAAGAPHAIPAFARLVGVIVAMLIAYLSATAYGAYTYSEAIKDADSTPLDELRERLERARRFAPGADVVLIARTDLELQALESLLRTPGTSAAALTNQYDLASFFVSRTLGANPYRPDGFEFQGRLELMDWRRPGPERVEAAIEAFAMALTRNPARPYVREQLAQMMQALGRFDGAAQVFADGVAWAKTPSDELRFGIQALRAYLQAGNRGAAQALRETIVAAAERERLRGNDLGDIAGMTDALLREAPP